MDSRTEIWRKYLSKDPTWFLLDVDANPSVYLWYLIDLAHRPEDSAAVKDARERVLYSSPVQDIFAAQNGEGHWGTPDSLAIPYYRATLWNLALLAELGIPRDSRRARMGCEFALEGFLDKEGRFADLGLVESSYLIHAMSYFRLVTDERLQRAARSLTQLARDEDSIETRVMLLWAWANFGYDPEISAEAGKAREKLLDFLAASADWGFAPILFPPFDPRDGLFSLRVLAIHGAANDPRARRLVAGVLNKQNKQSLWPLEKTLNGSLTAHLEEESSASRWATLNALRVIIGLVMSAKG